jgi:hypothetical protein
MREFPNGKIRLIKNQYLIEQIYAYVKAVSVLGASGLFGLFILFKICSWTFKLVILKKLFSTSSSARVAPDKDA